MATKKQKFAVLIAKTDSGIKKLSYHGDRWIVRGTIDKIKFQKTEGPFVILMSRDGKQCLYVKENDDPDFKIRLQE